MSSCIKDLFAYELVKRCKCRVVDLKNNFHRKKTRKDG